LETWRLPSIATPEFWRRRFVSTRPRGAFFPVLIFARLRDLRGTFWQELAREILVRGSDGALRLCEVGGNRIRRIELDGTIRTMAGIGRRATEGTACRRVRDDLKAVSLGDQTRRAVAALWASACLLFVR
jgi:hypothetical protein